MKKLVLLFALVISNISVIGQNFDQILKKYPEFSGTILIAHKGQTIYQKSAGKARLTFIIDNTNDTKYRICSITKTFTVVMILQLLEEGKLKLSDTIGKFLPEYTGEAKDKVSIHQLITYSSGIENQDQNNEAMYALKQPIDSLLVKYCSGKLVNEPGKQFDYKNADYIILGKIIEAITQQKFEVNLQNRILNKLNIENTGMLNNSLVLENLANPYLYNDSTKQYSNEEPYWIENFFSAGAMYATASDLLKFSNAIFNSKIIHKNTLELMLTSYPKLWSVAYGFWVSENEYKGKKYRCADRQGSISGSNTSWLHVLDTDFTFIILSNNNATNLNSLRTELVENTVK